MGTLFLMWSQTVFLLVKQTPMPTDIQNEQDGYIAVSTNYISVNFALWSKLCRFGSVMVGKWLFFGIGRLEWLDRFTLLLIFLVKLLNKRDDCLVIRCDTLEGTSLSFVDSWTLFGWSAAALPIKSHLLFSSATPSSMILEVRLCAPSDW